MVFLTDREMWSAIERSMPAYASLERVVLVAPGATSTRPDAAGTVLVAPGHTIPLLLAEKEGLVEPGTTEEAALGAVRRAFAKARAVVA